VSGETDLKKILAIMQPGLLAGEFVFCSLPGEAYGDLAELNPIASYQEVEGLSLILEKSAADRAELSYESVFRAITLSVHSSLDAVGFTATVCKRLAENGISTNVVAATFHDHLFVPSNMADKAVQLLMEMEE